MEQEHTEEQMPWWNVILSGGMLVIGLLFPYFGLDFVEKPQFMLAWYLLAFAFVGLPVMKEAWETALKGDVFSEFMLMTIACIGAFAIGEYPEGVAVMLLYCIGEALQDRAVDRARDNIQELIAFRPTVAKVVVQGKIIEKSPEEVQVGDILEVKAGDRVPLDGKLVSASAAFNTAALTGESLPRTFETGGEVLAGMIAVDAVSHLEVVRPASESAVSRILNMVESAAERKAPTELFIRRFARIYTPIVIGLALLTVVCPYLYSIFDSQYSYVFTDWFRRALVFLVISCPCALVISVPLSYFAGIGLASKHGILFKGSNYLDAITEVDVVAFDKTGTLTTGEFAVQSVVGLDQEALQTVAAMEKSSNHPIAQAILKYCPTEENISSQDIAGYGLKNDEWLVGNLKLLDREQVSYADALRSIPETVVAVARKGKYMGHIILADTIKEDAKKAISDLPVRAEMLSGDRQELVTKVAADLGISHAYGDLLPDGKVLHLQNVKKAGERVAFVGDGINDAPVLALSDVGIAMGGLGSDMAIETADVIIQTDQPSKVACAMRIGRYTRRIVHQNIALALGVKAVVMLLGLLGFANLWMAVFADSGVALLAVLNAARIFFKKQN
ncbi:heavy metal translocating P-type ATPase [Hoylesella timonensis]|uniref:P-type Zn(2+) transporter n=1 Tax=Hoylesella timonensis S9-PR14 TaxID=1401062 RepID=A0A098YUC2_9BACT|nr:heavy metal translocating P-type ATPase [Hoylesella timonensis]KGI22957.1 metal ABC transporter ATPase [Hoylesella timonensis S9-PR14]